MKLSIITVTYNAENDIIPTMESILKQYNSDFELIIVDGCSNDKTLKMVEDYNERFQYMRIISEPDNGIYDAMNKGVALAKGEYVFFLNAGDVLFDNTVFDKVLPSLNGIDVYYGDSYRISNGLLKPFRSGEFTKYRLAVINICHQTIFYPRMLLLENPYNLDYILGADHALNMLLWEKRPFKYVNFPISLYKGDGVSENGLNKDKKFVKDYKWLVASRLGIDALIYLAIKRLIARF